MSMTFKTYEYADISTGYLEPEDLIHIGEPGAPYHMAKIDDGSGSFFYVPSFDATSEEEYAWGEEEMRAFGLSERFVAIMRALRDQAIPYVRFDANGSDVEGLTVINHDEAEGNKA